MNSIPPQELKRAEEIAVALVRKWWLRLKPRPATLELEDLEQEARLEVLRAQERFDPAKGARFSTFGANAGLLKAKTAVARPSHFEKHAFKNGASIGSLDEPPAFADGDGDSLLERLPDPLNLEGQIVDELEREWQSARVQAALERLPPAQATTLRLRFWEGLSVRAIGARQGVSGETARSYLRKGLEALRVTLTENEARPTNQQTIAAELDRRGVDLRQKVPAEIQQELAEQLSSTTKSVSACISTLRRERGITLGDRDRPSLDEQIKEAWKERGWGLGEYRNWKDRDRLSTEIPGATAQNVTQAQKRWCKELGIPVPEPPAPPEPVKPIPVAAPTPAPPTPEAPDTPYESPAKPLPAPPSGLNALALQVANQIVNGDGSATLPSRLALQERLIVLRTALEFATTCAKDEHYMVLPMVATNTEVRK